MKERLVVLEMNLFDLFIVFSVNLAGLVLQIGLHELPCPLCLLQRLGILAISFGFLMNLRFGARTTHYAYALGAALFNAAVAGRQILLHITPGSGAYGSPLFGLHAYTWSFLVSVGIIASIMFILIFEKQFTKKRALWSRGFPQWGFHLIFALAIGFAAINFVSTFLECGWGPCPDNPTRYFLLK